MAGDWQAGLKDQDELDSYPSAANPLTALGIDPDEARANPSLLARMGGLSRTAVDPSSNPHVRPSPVMDANAPEESKPSTSSVMAGKLGGAGDATPPATPEAEPTDAEGYGMAGLGLLNKNLKGATNAADEIGTTPPADIARLTQQREKLATPARRFDPVTGKPLAQAEEYDPDTGQMVKVDPNATRGQKIWRGVRGGLVGLLTGGIPGAAVGALEPQDIRGGQAYNAPSKAYQQAEQRREQQLGATDANLKNAFQTWKDQVAAQKEKAGEYRSTATLGKDLTTGATGLINAENKPETEDRKSAAKLKLTQDEFNQRSQQIQGDPTLSRLSPLQKSLYLANGKLPDPREPNEADVTAAQIARGIAILGHQPQTLEELNQVVAAAKGTFGKKGASTEATPQQLRAIADKKNGAVEKANSEFAKRAYAPGGKQEYQRQLQAAQNAYEEDMSLVGQAGPHQIVTVDAKGQVTWTPEAPPAAPAAPAGPGPVAAPPATGKKAATPPPMPAAKLPDGTSAEGQNGEHWVVKGGKWQPQQ